MAFTYPVALHFPPFDRKDLPACVERCILGMRRYSRFPSALEGFAAELVFQKHSGEWLDTIEITGRDHTVESMLARGRWLRLTFETHLGRGSYFIELYIFPLNGSPDKGALQLNFDGRSYAALFDFQPRALGGFDQEAKSDFFAVCDLIAREARPDAFILLPEEGSLLTYSLEDIVERLRHPSGNRTDKRVGLITGAKEKLVSMDDLRKIWRLPVNDSRLLTTSSGYCVLDLVQKFIDE